MTPSSPPTVLVVDDDPSMVSLYEALLSDRARVRSAHGVAGAGDHLDGAIDAALLDRQLGDGVGDELAVAAPSLCATALVTGVRPGPELVDVPVEDYLRKPVDGDAVLDLLEVLLARRSLDPPARACAAMLSKRAVLERQYDRSSLLEHPQYRRLRVRLARRREQGALDHLRDGGRLDVLFREEVRERVAGMLDATTGAVDGT
jgi:two-component system response regulator AdeR